MGWLEYSEWFVASLNKIYADGWFRGHDDLHNGNADDKTKAKLLKFISHNGSGSVENYRLQDLKKGLGAWLCILIVQNGEELDPDMLLESVSYHCDAIEPSLVKGFKRQATAELVDEGYEGTKAAYSNEVKERAYRYLEKRMKEIRKYFGVDGE